MEGGSIKMFDILTSPLFYLFFTILIYFLFALLLRKTKLPIFNPLLWTIIFIIGYLLLIIFWGHGQIDEAGIEKEVDKYQRSTVILDMMLSPVTVALAVPLYINRHLVKENWLVILVATIVGVASSFLTVYLLSLALNLDKSIMLAILPRGVTTAIAKEAAAIMGVSVELPITVSMVVITGVVGATLGPILFKLFRTKDEDDLLIGLSLGSASHAVGTSKAFSYSQRAGSIASVSIITNGLLTVIVSLIISVFLK